MATIASSAVADRGEARFFLTMACVMAVAIVAGFSFNIVMGRSSFDAPWLVHIHAWVMLGWVGLYVTQNALVFTDQVAVHRRLGWLSLFWIPAILVLGVLITRWSLQARGGPPFFDQNQFLISNPMHIAGFAALAAWAVSVRRTTAWHRRLMYCAFAMLTAPGVARLLPSPLFIPYTWYVEAVTVPILFMLAGVVADRRRYGRAHPAWFWGIGTVLVIQVAADLIAYSDAGIAFTRGVIAGTPGANRPMEAFFPQA